MTLVAGLVTYDILGDTGILTDKFDVLTMLTLVVVGVLPVVVFDVVVVKDVVVFP